MSKIYLVYDEYCNDGANMFAVYPCATMEVAIKKVQERLKWNLENTYLNQFVDENLKPNEDLGDWDTWEVEEDSVTIYIDSKNTSLNINIAEEEIICD
jgi:hypothetical protein